MAGGGVWVFRKDGVMELERQENSTTAPSKALVYVPAKETMRSLEALERRLGSLGWERYYENRDIVQLHRRDGGVDLISLPRHFVQFRSAHMYDIVVKNRGACGDAVLLRLLSGVLVLWTEGGDFPPSTIRAFNKGFAGSGGSGGGGGGGAPSSRAGVDAGVVPQGPGCNFLFFWGALYHCLTLS